MLHLPTGPHGRKQPHVVSLGCVGAPRSFAHGEQQGNAAAAPGIGHNSAGCNTPVRPCSCCPCRQLQRAGMLRTGPQSAQFEATLAKWWSRVGPEAAASTAYAID